MLAIIEQLLCTSSVALSYHVTRDHCKTESAALMQPWCSWHAFKDKPLLPHRWASSVFPCQLHFCCTADRYFGLWPGCSPMADGVSFPLEAPPTVVTILMRALYHYTLLLKASQERLQKAKEVFKSALAVGNKTSALPGRDLAAAKIVLTADREWFGEATT